VNTMGTETYTSRELALFAALKAAAEANGSEDLISDVDMFVDLGGCAEIRAKHVNFFEGFGLVAHDHSGHTWGGRIDPRRRPHARFAVVDTTHLGNKIQFVDIHPSWLA